jgi:hypothetical protein
MPFEWWKDNEYMKENMKIFFEVPNPEELYLFMLWPSVALKHIENSNLARDRSIALRDIHVLSGYMNGNADAFRHAFWNALGTAEFGSFKMEMLASAHEAYSSGITKDMDLFNNNIGRNIAENSQFNASTSDGFIENEVLNFLFNGSLVYINNNVLVPTP